MISSLAIAVLHAVIDFRQRVSWFVMAPLTEFCFYTGS